MFTQKDLVKILRKFTKESIENITKNVMYSRKCSEISDNIRNLIYTLNPTINLEKSTTICSPILDTTNQDPPKQNITNDNDRVFKPKGKQNLQTVVVSDQSGNIVSKDKGSDAVQQIIPPQDIP